jgi:hypothetical protein
VTTVAGVVIVTEPGASTRVACRLAGVYGLTLAGGDGDARLAGVWEAADGRALERLAEQLVERDPEILGVFPTFVGLVPAPPSPGEAGPGTGRGEEG